MMKLDAFKENVDLHSADLSRWPVALVKPALALMEAETEAKDYFATAQQAEDDLRAYDPLPAETTALQNRILAAINAPTAFSDELATASKKADKSAKKTFGFSWKPAYIFAPGGGLLAAAILGFIIGVLPQSSSVSSTDYLVDPVYYAKDKIINADSDFYNGGLF